MQPIEEATRRVVGVFDIEPLPAFMNLAFPDGEHQCRIEECAEQCLHREMILVSSVWSRPYGPYGIKQLVPIGLRSVGEIGKLLVTR